MKKTYRFEHWETSGVIDLTVDTEFKNSKTGKTFHEYAKECVEFWAGSADQLNQFNGSYLLAHLQNIARYSFYEALRRPCTLELIREYWQDPPEGFYPLDDMGIEIKVFNCPSVDFDDLDWEEILPA